MANEGQLKPDVDGNARLGSDCVWLLRSCVELKGEEKTQMYSTNMLLLGKNIVLESAQSERMRSLIW